MTKSHSGTDISSGFPLAAIDEVVNNASKYFDVDTIINNTSIFNPNIYDHIVSLVHKVSSEFEIESNIEQPDDISELSNSSSSDDSDIDFCISKYHACIISDKDSD